MTRTTECGGRGGGVGKGADCGAAVLGADACRAALKLVDSNGKRCAQNRSVVINLMRQVKLAATARCDRGAKHTAGMFEHKVHLLGCDFFGCDNYIALILTVFVVYDYNHFALAEILYGFRYTVQFNLLVHLELCS